MATEILLTLTEAIDRAGPRLFGKDDWIGELSTSDCDVLSKFGPKPHGQPQQTIGPCPDKWRHRLNRVMGADLRLGIQRATVLDWIFSARVLTSRNKCDRAQLDRAIAKSEPIASNRGAPKSVQLRVIHDMQADLRSGAATRELLAAMKPLAMQMRYRASRKTCLNARQAALSEAARLSFSN